MNEVAHQLEAGLVLGRNNWLGKLAEISQLFASTVLATVAIFDAVRPLPSQSLAANWTTFEQQFFRISAESKDPNLPHRPMMR